MEGFKSALIDIRIANLCCISFLLRQTPCRQKEEHPAYQAVYRSAMRVLLLSMPDSFEHTPTLAIRIPNGALTSLAGNIDEHHHCAVADLVLAQSTVRGTVEQLLRDHLGLKVPARH